MDALIKILLVILGMMILWLASTIRDAFQSKQQGPAGNALFHGACINCTQQNKHGIGFCTGCCYFDPDWTKPNLRHTLDMDETELLRAKARKEAGL